MGGWSGGPGSGWGSVVLYPLEAFANGRGPGVDHGDSVPARAGFRTFVPRLDVGDQVEERVRLLVDAVGARRWCGFRAGPLPRR